MANKKLTLKSIIAHTPDVKTTDLYLNTDPFNDVALTVKHTLGLDEAMRFVQDVVGTCVDDDEAAYMPELFDFAVRVYVITYYAGIEMPKDVSKAYGVLYCTDLYDRIIDIIDRKQFDVLIDAIMRRIEHWRRMMEASVAQKVAKLVEQMDELMEGNKDLIDKIDDDSFKDAIARLAELNLINNADGSEAARAPSVADDITEEDILSAETLMKGILKGDTREADNIVYLPKK